ncbi:MAG: hypothetical protein LH473_04155 [Chitinophagales bacterium]|nr:hypothetical protein [Chitinophagales bacterium]
MIPTFNLENLKAMSITELKNSITERINLIDDLNRLQEIDNLLQWEIQLDEKGVYHLNDEQIAIVKESEEQIKRGEYLTDEEVRKKTAAWLKK